jgi:hypothetical protein
MRHPIQPTQRSFIMHMVDTDDKNKGSLLEQELIEENFFEQFAALEESLAVLQVHMRAMSENAKLFGNLVTQIRRSVCPAVLARGQTRPVPTCRPRSP